MGRRIVKISLHLNKRRHVEVDDFVISMRSFQRWLGEGLGIRMHPFLVHRSSPGQ